MIPTTIHDLAKPRPTTHGQVTDQEIRVGQSLLAQAILALIARIDRLLAERTADEGPPAPRSGIDILKRAIAKAERAPREPKPCAPKPAPASAPVEPPSPVELRSNGVPVDLALRYHEAYLDGAAARLTGALVETNPYTGSRGIAGGRRLAWVRGWQSGGA